MMQEPERQDLSALAPDSERFERMVSGIMRRAAHELRRRQTAVVRLPGFGVFDGLLAWSRPALATAATLALLSLIALSRLDRSREASVSDAYFHSAALPAAVEVYLEAGQAPTALDMLVIAGGEN